MAERWRKPVVPLAIELHDTETILLPDGREHVRPVFPLKEEDIERMRAGYVCAKCFEPHEEAWPEYCNFCRVSIRREQAAYFAREYAGVTYLGPRTSLEEEIGGIEERLRKEEEMRQPNGDS